MRALLYCCVGVVLVGGVALGADPASRNVITLKVGEQRLLSVPDLRELVMADPAIADATTLGESQIVIRGEAAGQTTLTATLGKGEKRKISVTVSAEKAAAAPPASGKASSDAAAGTPIALTVGVEHVVTVPGLEGVAALDPEVADARAISAKAVVIRGIGAGTGRVVVLHQGGKRVEYAVKVGPR